MIDTDCAFFSSEVFLQERFPVSRIHQVSKRVIEERSVGHNVILFIGQSHGQIGFLSGRWRRAERKQEADNNIGMTLQHFVSDFFFLQKDAGRVLFVCHMITHKARFHSYYTDDQWKQPFIYRKYIISMNDTSKHKQN